MIRDVLVIERFKWGPAGSRADGDACRRSGTTPLPEEPGDADDPTAPRQQPGARRGEESARPDRRRVKQPGDADVILGVALISLWQVVHLLAAARPNCAPSVRRSAQG